MLLITDRAQAQNPLEKIIEAALLGGCRWVSLREKDLPAEDRAALVKKVLPIVQAFDGTLLVHDDLDAAALTDGIHLPAGASVADARARLSENKRIGLSCHTVEEVARARGADYVTLGPFAPTKSKPGYAPTLTTDAFKEAAELGLPVLALGGVDESNVGALRRAGAAGFAVMGSVMRNDNPEGLVKRLLAAWERDS